MNYLSHRRSAMRSGKHCICNIKRVRALKSHTCEEGAAHLRITVWHLLMNLKNNYLLKNCWSGPIKNIRILIFTKKKDYFTPVYQKSYSYDLQFLRYRMWQNEIGICGSFFALLPPPPPPPKILKKKKKKKCTYLMKIFATRMLLTKTQK